MKTAFVKFLSLVSLASLLTFDSAWGEVPQKAPEPIPTFVLNALYQATYYEEFFSQIAQPVMSFLKEGGLDEALVEKQERDWQTRKRLEQIVSVLTFDADNDGRVTFAELGLQADNAHSNADVAHKEPNRQAVQLKALDTNNDSVIDYAEMRILKKPENQKKVNRYQPYFDLPATKNGKLTYQGLASWAREIFAQVDTNTNGMLSAEEKKSLLASPMNSANKVPVRQLSEAEKLLNTKIPLTPDEELHVVSVDYGNIESGGATYDPHITARVDRPGKKVVLVLSSREGIKWLISATQGTAITSIHVSNTGDLPSSVQVNGKAAPFQKVMVSSVFSTENIQFAGFIEHLESLTGRKALNSFHGSTAAQKKTFVIDAAGAEKGSLPITATEALPKMVVRANINNKNGEYDLSGKMMKAINLVDEKGYKAQMPFGRKIIFSPATQKYFSTFSGNYCGIQRWNEIAKTFEDEVKYDGHGCRGYAYDTKRNEVLVVRPSKERNLLYRYDVVAKTTSTHLVKGAEIAEVAYDEATAKTIGTNVGTILQYPPNERPEHISFYDIQENGEAVLIDNLPIGLFNNISTGGRIDVTFFPNGDFWAFVIEGEYEGTRRIYLYDRNKKVMNITYAGSATIPAFRQKRPNDSVLPTAPYTPQPLPPSPN